MVVAVAVYGEEPLDAWRPTPIKDELAIPVKLFAGQVESGGSLIQHERFFEGLRLEYRFDGWRLGQEIPASRLRPTSRQG